jgi:LysR family transcriptional regulator, glycine cleavage system transcriptional activator
MTYILPPLNGLRAFEAAARHLSIKQAAHELHVTPGAVSQRIHALEERLGIELFERLHKRLVLTAAGAAYLPAVREAFQRIAAATTAIRGDGIAVTLSVGLHPAFDFRRLKRELARFRALHPAIGVRIIQPAGLRELAEGKIDLLIGRGGASPRGYRYDPLDTTRGANAGRLISPQGTAACAEVECFRAWLLASRRPKRPSAARLAPNLRHAVGKEGADATVKEAA